MNEQTAEKTSISLFPRQRQIVEVFAEEQNRTFSNALQFIIEDWMRMKQALIQSGVPATLDKAETVAVPA